MDDGEVGLSSVVRHCNHLERSSCLGILADVQPCVALQLNRLAGGLHRTEDACITNAMFPRRPTDTNGDNLAMAVNDGSSHEGTTVSDTTVDLRRMSSDGAVPSEPT